MPSGKQTNLKIKIVSTVLGLIVLVAMIFGSYYFYTQSQSSPYQNGYQAVFLSNDQVYFGNISKENDGWVNLEDVYYLKVEQKLQGQTDMPTSSQSSSEITLKKLGNELHGPKDKMKINKKQILFIEHLSQDSKVVSAIKKHHLKN
jgi:hypothetical protein